MRNKPLLLDLFCGAGGCTKGYQEAGFYVVGVDSEPQPHYCGDEFYQADALTFDLAGFDVLHASPVCKAYTICNRPNQKSTISKDDYPRLISDVRARFVASGKPYIIENVVGAKRDLSANLMLCGSMFGLPMARERLFEIGNVNGLFIIPPGPRDKKIEHISVVGGSVWDSRLVGTTRRDGRARPDSVAVEIGRQAMGINWMTKKEMAQAIPPAYTRHIGLQLIAFLASRENECVVA